jgi:light-independent protochlorophyllide reductase subunit N
VGSCPSEVIKLDLSRAAERLSPVHAAVRVLNYSGSGIETTFTQGEDACLAALVPELPAEPGAPQPSAGGRHAADVVEDQFRAPVRADRHRPGAVLPAAPPPSMPARRPEHRYLLAQPFLADTARALEARGAAAPAGTLSPGRRRHHRWLQAAAAPSASARALRVEQSPRRRANAPQQAAGPPPRAAGRQAHLLLPRLAARGAAGALPGARTGHALVEVGTPYLHREHLAAELALLPAGTALSEGQDVERQLDRCRAARPTSWCAAWAWPTRWRPRA